MFSGFETGNLVRGLKEYSINGVRFVFRPGKGSAIISFSAFPPRLTPQKYNYIKDFENSEKIFLSFLDRDAPEEDPRGTYYVDDNLGDEYLQKMHEIVQLSGARTDTAWLLGSSKGAVGALLFGLTYGFQNIYVNAPQYRIATYIRRRSKEIIELLAGPENSNWNMVENILANRIDHARTDIIWNINITCGVDDDYHLAELSRLGQKLNSKGITFKMIQVPGGHDGTSVDYYRKGFAGLRQGHAPLISAITPPRRI